MKIKIIFLGTPEFGAIILDKLVKNNYKPCLVITEPDKPVGRKQILTPPPVKLVAQKYNLLIVQPQKIENCKLKIENLNPDLIIVSAYSQILSKEILEIPKYGCLNIHPSLLPKYRGPAPIQTTILNGDKETGITIILMDEKIDHGEIVSSIKYQLPNNITYENLSKKLANLGAELLIETIPRWVNGKIVPKTQNESKATYTKILKKEDGKINWEKPAEQIERQVRAFYPWPGTFAFWKNKRIKILEAESGKSIKSCSPPGKTFLNSKNKLCVCCGKNYLIVKKLQIEGKKPINSDGFLRGHPDFIGSILK